MKNPQYMDKETAEKLAEATVNQFYYRLAIEKIEHQSPVLDKKKFYDFFISLPIPANPSGGLILSTHKKPCDFPKEYMQSYEIRRPTPVADLEIYPRGVIISSKIEEDISRSIARPFSDKVRAEIVRFNRRIGPRVAPYFGKQGKHMFPSELAYMKMLRDEEISKLLLAEAKKQEPFFGFMRVDYNKLKPRNKEPGWLLPKETAWIKAFPVIIIPGITTEQLEIMVDKERKMLGLMD